jgi:hypothetical protein
LATLFRAGRQVNEGYGHFSITIRQEGSYKIDAAQTGT